MIKTIIKNVDVKDQRYPTLGDYYLTNTERIFSISNTGRSLYDDLILIHELVEEVLTRNKGIKEEDITKYDLEFEKKVELGVISGSSEPGEQLDCPYRREHILAETIERLILNHLGEDFNEYNNKLNNLFE